MADDLITLDAGIIIEHHVVEGIGERVGGGARGSGGGRNVDVVGGLLDAEGLRAGAEGRAGELGIKFRMPAAGVEDVGIETGDLDAGNFSAGGVKNDIQRILPMVQLVLLFCVSVIVARANGAEARPPAAIAIARHRNFFDGNPPSRRAIANPLSTAIIQAVR